MATVLGLNRCTQEQSTLKLSSLHMPLTSNATVDQEGYPFVSSQTWGITRKAHAAGWKAQLPMCGTTLLPCSLMWRHKAELGEHPGALLMYTSDTVK